MPTRPGPPSAASCAVPASRCWRATTRCGRASPRSAPGWRTERCACWRAAVPILLAEAALYRYGDNAEDRGSETPVDEHNHALAALRYLISRLDARQMARNRRAPDMPPRESPSAAGKKRPWLRLDNEALWTQVVVKTREPAAQQAHPRARRAKQGRAAVPAPCRSPLACAAGSRSQTLSSRSTTMQYPQPHQGPSPRPRRRPGPARVELPPAPRRAARRACRRCTPRSASPAACWPTNCRTAG